jgi:predicted metal-dependent HD superfamily phosphohydrolase
MHLADRHLVNQSLYTAWQTLLPEHPEIGQYLLQRWNLPDRHYHGPTHLQTCLDALIELGSSTRSETLAIWFHDAVHTNTPGLDELRSAELAAGMLGSTRLATAEIDEVCRLIRLTEGHQPDPDDAAGARVCDADLAVLGADPRTYLRSVTELHLEQPGDSWIPFRLEQLRGLLAADPLFHSPYARQHWSARAAANLAAELETLAQQPPQ